MTAPGVYVTEVRSAVRSITGVGTSITAFIGRARRGPLDTAVTVTSPAEFTRTFGGPWDRSALPDAVLDFFTHGGSTAIVVRVHEPQGAKPTDDCATITLGQLVLQARSPGRWGSSVRVTATRAANNADPKSPFTLTVTDGLTTEIFTDIETARTSTARVDRILETRSSLVRTAGEIADRALEIEAADPPGDGQRQEFTATDGSDGQDIGHTRISGDQADGSGLYALDVVDLVNLLVVPPYVPDDTGIPTDTEREARTAAAMHARRRRAIYVCDPPAAWTTPAEAVNGRDSAPTDENTAVYFPRVRRPAAGGTAVRAVSGAIAGIIAANDARRGVWKAPAGLDTALLDVVDLDVPLTDAHIGLLNPRGINCLRRTPGVGHVVWGARTAAGADTTASEWKYLPVRRTALYLEESLYRGLQWCVFEPNDVRLRAAIRLNVTTFLDDLYRRGAFAGSTAREAYFVKCDDENTTQADVDRGVVNVDVGFAANKPAEFVYLRLQQIAGALPT